MRIGRIGFSVLATAALVLGGAGLGGSASAAPTQAATVAAKPAAVAAAPVATLTYHQRRCDRDQVALGLRNNLAASATYQVRVFNSTTGITQYRTLGIGAGGTAYFFTFGVKGSYSAPFYRLVGGSYVYTGVLASGTNDCKVSATLQRSGTSARVVLKNNGTAYALVYSRKLAPAVANYLTSVAPGATVATPWSSVGVAGTRFAFAEDILGGTVLVMPPYFTGVS